MSIILTNGTVVTEDNVFRADIAIKNEKIYDIGPDLDTNDYDKEHDVNGYYIFPGFIDPHVHLKLPMRGTFSADDFVTGTRAAAAGGVTTIIDFATQMGDQSLIDAVSKRRKEADNNVYVDYGLHGGITNWSVVKNEINELKERGVSSFKMFMAYKERGLYSPDEDIKAAMKSCREHNCLILLHAESEDILKPLYDKYSDLEKMQELGIRAHILSRPNIVEVDAIERAIEMSDQTGGHVYIVHISTGKGAELIHEARNSGLNVIGETCPQYLMFNDEVFEKGDGYLFATAPQIKSEEDRQNLWQQTKTGGIQVIGTDSCTFTKEQKDTWNGDFTKLPLGLPGTELMGPLIYSEGVKSDKLSLNKFVELTSSNAAKIYGLYPKKGTISIGSDADLTVFNPNDEFIVDYRNMETNSDWNPYQSWQIKGKPIMTFVRGTLVGKNGKCVGKKGYGKFLKRSKSGNFV